MIFEAGLSHSVGYGYFITWKDIIKLVQKYVSHLPGKIYVIHEVVNKLHDSPIPPPPPPSIHIALPDSLQLTFLCVPRVLRAIQCNVFILQKLFDIRMSEFKIRLKFFWSQSGQFEALSV